MDSAKTAKRKILLVDDDPSLLVTVGQFLKFEGYDVTTVDSGEQALEALQTLRPNLIILDMSMPGMGGVGFLQRITGEDDKPLYPVLVLTARAQMAEFFANLEVDGFIAKPAEPNDLLAEVGRILFLRGNDEPADYSAAAGDRVLPRLLVGEQDAAQAIELQAALEGAGYSVEVVASGPVALELALSGKPDLVLLRADLAQLDAWSLIGLIRQMPSISGIPVLVYGTDGAGSTAQTDDYTVQVGDNDAESILSVLDQFFESVEDA